MAHGARLGQHFLKSPWAAKAVAYALDIRKGDMVLEIGPGKGILTSVLLERGARVAAIEKDPPLVTLLREKFAQEIRDGSLIIHEDDVRSTSSISLGLTEKPYIVIANIPYYITGEIIRQFLTDPLPPNAMSLLVQKEVAQRIVAKKESILSLSVKAFGEPRIAAKVPRIHFSPPPAVDSAVLVIENISRNFFTTISEADFFQVVRAGFASKRKLLLNNLAQRWGKDVATLALIEASVAPAARAEDVPLDKWAKITRSLTANSPSS